MKECSSCCGEDVEEVVEEEEEEEEDCIRQASEWEYTTRLEANDFFFKEDRWNELKCTTEKMSTHNPFSCFTSYL